jgi:O-acetyl-ADP-ribose deacetylase (regulator of RNase III)
MIIETIKGNLLTEFKNQKFSAIGHGCNCFCVMGAGIAGQISKEFPEALEADVNFDEVGSWKKLGYFSSVKTQYGDIHNFYTQYLFGANFEYSALILSMITLEEMITKYDDIETYVLGLPMIGAGIGSGDWNIIKEILEATSIKIIVVEYDNGNISMGQGEINFPS